MVQLAGVVALSFGSLEGGGRRWFYGAGGVFHVKHGGSRSERRELRGLAVGIRLGSETAGSPAEREGVSMFSIQSRKQLPRDGRTVLAQAYGPAGLLFCRHTQ